MVECLKQIIREYRSLEPSSGLPPRRVVIGGLPGKVSVVTGVKRSEIRFLSEAIGRTGGGGEDHRCLAHR